MNPDDVERLIRARLLIVEDEGIVAKDLQNTLVKAGYVVVGTAATGKEAIEKASLHEPDLILMDISLRDDMDGIDAAAAILNARDVPVVFLTAYADPATLARAAEIGPYGYILKPFDDRVLQVSVMMALCRHRTESRIREAERIAHESRARAIVAEERLRAHEEFLSVASHELRTPVTALKLQLEVLRTRLQDGPGGLPSAVLETTDRANLSVSRLATLVEGVIDVSRMALGEFALRREKLDLVEALREAIQRYQRVARALGSEIVLDGAEGPIPGSWDPDRIHLVLNHLLSNAVKFGAGKPIEVTVRRNETDAVVCVRDHGPGFDAETAERVLMRFERGVSHHKYGGLGLGLYIVQRIVEAHHGELEVKSSPGNGASFTVKLPHSPPIG